MHDDVEGDASEALRDCPWVCAAVETVAHYELAEAIGEDLPVAEVRAHGAAIAAMLTKMMR